MSHSNYSKSGQLIHPEETSLYIQSKGPNHADSEFEFMQPLHLKSKLFTTALTKLKVWLTMINVSGVLNNNTLTYFSGGALQPVIGIPDGNYSVFELNNYLSRRFVENGLASNFIQFDGSSATGKITMILQIGARVDNSATNPGLVNLLGLNPSDDDNGAGTVPLYSDGNTEPKLNHYLNTSTGQAVEVNSIYVHCDIVDGTMYGNSLNNPSVVRSSHAVIYKWSPVAQANSLQIEEPYNLDFMFCKSIDTLQNIRLFMTNENNEALDGFFTKPIYYSLKLKEHK